MLFRTLFFQVPKKTIKSKVGCRVCHVTFEERTCPSEVKTVKVKLLLG